MLTLRIQHLVSQSRQIFSLYSLGSQICFIYTRFILKPLKSDKLVYKYFRRSLLLITGDRNAARGQKKQRGRRI